jgi:hypothetical protein
LIADFLLHHKAQLSGQLVDFADWGERQVEAEQTKAN